MQHMNVVPCKDVVDYLHDAVDGYVKIMYMNTLTSLTCVFKEASGT